jgi:hypothetical protein
MSAVILVFFMSNRYRANIYIHILGKYICCIAGSPALHADVCRYVSDVISNVTSFGAKIISNKICREK